MSRVFILVEHCILCGFGFPFLYSCLILQWLIKFGIWNVVYFFHKLKKALRQNFHDRNVMAFATVQLSTDGRRNLGILLTGLCLLQFLIGLAILSCGIHFVKNLQWRILVIDNYDPYALGLTILVMGGLLSFVHLCGAKIFYDSSKEGTRHRFECLLFFMVALFLSFLVVDLCLILACKIHLEYKVETFRQGFLMAVSKYSSNPEIKVHMDRLQLEDECCGADSFKDWLEIDWVAREYNPLANGKTPPYENSVYYPWNINLPQTLKQSPPAPVSGPNSPVVPPKEIPDISQSGHHHSSPGGFGPGPGPGSGSGPGPGPGIAIGYASNNPPYDKYNDNPDSLNSYNYNSEFLEATTLDKSKLDGYFRLPRRFKRDTRSRFSTQLLVVPWSCCSPDFNGPCIHDYVTQRYLTHALQAKRLWTGASLHQKGCAAQLKNTYNAYLQACFLLFCFSAVFQIIMVVCARYLETSVENVDLYNREDNSAPGYLLTSTCFGDSAAGDSVSFKPRKLNKGTSNNMDSYNYNLALSTEAEVETAVETETDIDSNLNADNNVDNDKATTLKSEYERLLQKKKKKRKKRHERKQNLINKLMHQNRNQDRAGAGAHHKRELDQDKIIENDRDDGNWIEIGPRVGALATDDDVENRIGSRSDKHTNTSSTRNNFDNEMNYEKLYETDDNIATSNQTATLEKSKPKKKKAKKSNKRHHHRYRNRSTSPSPTAASKSKSNKRNHKVKHHHPPKKL